MIKHEFIYLNKEELEKELEKTKMNIRVQKIVAEFIQEMAKKGHKKIDKRIEKDLQDFLNAREIEYKYTFYCNDNKKYEGLTHYDITLTVYFENYNGCANRINIISGWNDDINGGYYDNLLEVNQWASFQNIKENEEKTLKEYQNAFENLEIYNQKLKELVQLRNTFGYLAR